MTGLVTKNFRIHNAKEFADQLVGDNASNFYFFIARSTNWDNESMPPSVNDTVQEIELDSWDDILSIKRINSNDVINAIRRNIWEQNTVYDKYQSNMDFHSGENYYVTTNEFNVYKCIDNNNGSPSLSSPTGTSTNIIETADGYLWKFMYNITASDALRFVTPRFIPVRTLDTDDGSPQWAVQTSAINNSISNFSITSGGSGYVSTTGTVQNATINTVTLPTNTIVSNDYFNGYSIYISSGTGVGQVRLISGTNRTTNLITLTESFDVLPDNTSNFIISPGIVVTGSGEGWSGYSEITNGGISNVVTVNQGQDYTYAEVNVTTETGSGASLVPTISPVGGHGSDAVNELGGYNIIMNVTLLGSENDTFPVGNDYRVIGLLRDPILDSDGSLADGTVYSLIPRYTLTNISGTFVIDEEITGGTSNSTGNVVQLLDGDRIEMSGRFVNYTVGETITGVTSGATATISSVEESDIRRFSGEVLYVENRTPIARSENQQEDIKIIIQF